MITKHTANRVNTLREEFYGEVAEALADDLVASLEALSITPGETLHEQVQQLILEGISTSVE